MSGVIVANLVIVAVVVIAFILHNQKTATIDVCVVPTEAEITINGANYANYQSYDVAPGSYEAVIAMEGMESKTIKFDLTEDGYYKLSTYLTPPDGSLDYYWWNSEEMEALAQMIENSADGKILGNNAEQDLKAKELVARYRKKEAAEQNLPLKYVNGQANNGHGFINLYIYVGDDEHCEHGTGTCLVISDATGGNYDMAVDMVKEKGINLDDYEIVYQTAEKRERAY